MLVAAGVGHSLSERTATLVSAVALIVAAYSLLRPAVGDPLRYIGFRGAGVGLVLSTIVASLALIVPVLSLEALVLLRFKVPQEVLDALDRVITAHTVPELLYVLLVAALGAAVSEEFVFRGILQKSLASRLKPWLAILVASTVFGLLHTVWRLPPALLMGVFLGVLYWRTQSLVLPIIAHFTANTVSVLALFVAETHGEQVMPAWIREERPAPWWLVLGSLAVFVAASRVVWERGKPPEAATRDAAHPGAFPNNSLDRGSDSPHIPLP